MEDVTTVAQAPPAASLTWLARLNFCLADVRDGLGPFLGIFLMLHAWEPDDIGYVMTLSGLIGMLATTPAGMLVDTLRAKRGLIVAGTTLMMAATTLLLLTPSFLITATSQIIAALVGASLAPAVFSLTLGLAGPQQLARQLGINEAYNHGGNACSALLAGIFGYYWGIGAVFTLMGVMACAALFCTLKIRPQDINHHVARGLTHTQPASAAPSAFQVLTRSRQLQFLALILLLFHLANAAMLPLLGQSVTAQRLANPALYTAMTIIVAQGVMIPVALIVGRNARVVHYRLLFTLALLALTVRGAVAASWHSPWVLLPVQILDSIGAGILGVAVPSMVAHILKGSGHVSAGLGGVMTIQGIGAAFSPTLAGTIAHAHGYSMAFLVLGLVAAAGLLLWQAGGRRFT